MKKINFPLKINKEKRFFLKGSISFKDYSSLKEVDESIVNKVSEEKRKVNGKVDHCA